MNGISRRPRRWRVALAGALLATLGGGAQAQSVAFSGMLGDKALLIIDGQAKAVPVGTTVQGVKLVKLDGGQAQIEANGKVQILRLGGAAVVAGDTSGGGNGSRIILPAGSGGHYGGLGSINGHPMPFVVDTGATLVAMSGDMAAQLGLDSSAGTAMHAMSANGTVAARRLTLSRVTVGDVTIYNVDAMVLPQSMPVVLLGNSFLSHFQMHSDSNSLVLDKKN